MTIAYHETEALVRGIKAMLEHGQLIGPGVERALGLIQAHENAEAVRRVEPNHGMPDNLRRAGRFR